MVRKRDYWQIVAEGIRAVAEERIITYLLHFTRLENLEGILQHGLKSRRVLHLAEYDVYVSAADRLDGDDDAISASIGFFYPKMFESKRREAGDKPWAFLLLDASVLWRFHCNFHQRGLARNASHAVPGKRYGHFALINLFVDPVFRQSHDLPDHCPTYPDAEVQIQTDCVPSEFIVGVWVETERHADVVRSVFDKTGRPGPEIIVQAFTPRICSKPYFWG